MYMLCGQCIMFLHQISLQLQILSNCLAHNSTCLAHNSDKVEAAAVETAATETALQNETQQFKLIGTASLKMHTTHITTCNTSAFNSLLQGWPEASSTP